MNNFDQNVENKNNKGYNNKMRLGKRKKVKGIVYEK